MTLVNPVATLVRLAMKKFSTLCLYVVGRWGRLLPIRVIVWMAELDWRWGEGSELLKDPTYQ